MQSGRAVRTAIANCFGRAVLFGIFILACAGIAANAAPVRIVAIGASNTHGWYVGNQGAYPARLQDLLRARGIDAQVTNAGVPFDTTGMMLRRIERDVPNGTDIVIVQPGSNDLRFFGTVEAVGELIPDAFAGDAHAFLVPRTVTRNGVRLGDRYT